MSKGPTNQMTKKPVTLKKVSDNDPVTTKGRKPVDPNETREQKLARLANARMTKLVKQIGLLGNLAAYKPTEEQINKMMMAIGEACSRVESRLRGVRRDNVSFTL